MGRGVDGERGEMEDEDAVAVLRQPFKFLRVGVCI